MSPPASLPTPTDPTAGPNTIGTGPEDPQPEAQPTAPQPPGNVNNVTTMFARGPAEVRAEVYAGLDAGLDMIAPEGSVPLQTHLENILEIPRAVNDWMAEHPGNIYTRGRNGTAST